MLLIFALLMITNVTAKDMYVNSDSGLRVRSGAGTEYEILTVLPDGTRVRVLGTSGEWKKVVYGIEHAFVHSEYLTERTQKAPGSYLGRWAITAYAETGYPCANGNYPSVGYTVAHNSLDFGTEIYIEGVGYRVVEDRGPDWLGTEWFDLYLGDYWTCVEWGERYLDVYLIAREE